MVNKFQFCVINFNFESANLLIIIDMEKIMQNYLMKFFFN